MKMCLRAFFFILKLLYKLFFLGRQFVEKKDEWRMSCWCSKQIVCNIKAFFPFLSRNLKNEKKMNKKIMKSTWRMLVSLFKVTIVALSCNFEKIIILCVGGLFPFAGKPFASLAWWFIDLFFLEFLCKDLDFFLVNYELFRCFSKSLWMLVDWEDFKWVFKSFFRISCLFVDLIRDDKMFG
jgi:hypothetical protein